MAVVHDYEKLGAFYLGKRVDTASGQDTDEAVLYDARDLTTHAVIIGMTGSGKTGLGIGLLEEAAIDHVPVIAVDPKGDMGNLMLTFPNLSGDDFLPWVNTRQALDQGQTPEQFATAQAALWKKGLEQSGQDGERIRRFRDSAELAIYTPGSEAGLPVSVLQSFAAPGAALLADGDLYRERIQATATGLLALIGIETDPVSSREHILVSLIVDHYWQQSRDLDIGELIAALQKPPVERVGVLDVEAFFPARERFQLAMRLNNLLAAPGFASWMQGQPLDARSLLYTAEGKPRVSIMSIAHLDDAGRMFFVTMLLNELIAWMRGQQGTSSLRAVLYMDEIAGYLPPVANPSSKALFLTLLKQARAYGLGLVLATQNPVDLDYKALSNIGTWFIGRLQTERDKARVMEGLEGVSHGDTFDRQAMERTLAGLGKRRFLLHNVHDDEAIVFGTRWALSYLAGPMTRDQVRQLMAGADPGSAVPAGEARETRAATTASTDAPVLDPSIRQLYLPADGKDLVYHARLVAAAELAYSSSRYGVEQTKQALFTLEPDDGPVAVDWDNAEPLDQPLDRLESKGEPAAAYAGCHKALAVPKNFTQWEKRLRTWLRQQHTLRLFGSKKYRMVSAPDETEGEFRVRLQQRANEERDKVVAGLRQRYATKTTTLENRLLRAQHALQREAQQSSRKKFDTALSFGTAILGAVLGRKRLSATTASRVGTAMRSAGGARKEAGDVERAQETVAKVQSDLEELGNALQAEIDALDTAYDAQDDALDDIVVKAKSTDIRVPLLGVLWMPYRDDGDGRLRAAWTD